MTKLFGEALIAYKSGKKIEAVELIRRSNEINPYRLSIGKYLERWSEGAIRPLTPVQSQSQDKDYSYKILEAEDYTQDMYEAFGYDEGMGISFEHYLDTHGYL